MATDDVIDQVAALIRQVSGEVIEPRFRLLAEHEVREKSAGEIVTVVDEEAERQLAAGLAGILPGVPVVGEEAAAADPSLVGLLSVPGRAWLVDPVDGTSNYAVGSADWAVMVALVDARTIVASWIWQPVAGRMYIAERGGGAFRDGERLGRVGRAAEAGALRGAVLSRFFDEATAARVDRNRSGFGTLTAGRMCAGYEYPAIVEGEVDFALFWRTLPWDHAPGALLVEEAGGRVGRPDGTGYRPDQTGVGLLVAADEPTWALARTLLD